MTETHPPIESVLEYPILNPAFVPVRADDNTVHLRAGAWNGGKFTIEDEDGDGRLAAFVESLDGQTHVNDLLEEFSEAAELDRFLLRLYRKNVVVDAAGSDVDRRVHGFLTEGFRSPEEDLEASVGRLESSDVLVVGDGEMAEQISTDLAAIGAGSVTYWDADRSERVAFDHERATSSDAPLDSLLEEVDFAVVGVETSGGAVLDEFNRLAHETATPWLLCRIQGLDGQVGPLIVPGETSCYECFKRRRRTNLADYDLLESYERRRSEAPNGPLSTFAPFGKIVGGYATLDVVNYLTTGHALLAGRMMGVDLSTFTVDVNEVLRLPRCDVCGIDERAPEHDEYLTIETLQRSLGGDDD